MTPPSRGSGSLEPGNSSGDGTAFAVDLSDGRRLTARRVGREWRVQITGHGRPSKGKGYRLSEALTDAGVPHSRELLADALDWLATELGSDR
ncbi:MAG: hypothetical protein ACJ768_09320 [Gaiellaceae bacterium]